MLKCSSFSGSCVNTALRTNPNCSLSPIGVVAAFLSRHFQSTWLGHPAQHNISATPVKNSCSFSALVCRVRQKNRNTNCCVSWDPQSGKHSWPAPETLRATSSSKSRVPHRNWDMSLHITHPCLPLEGQNQAFSRLTPGLGQEGGPPINHTDFPVLSLAGITLL